MVRREIGSVLLAWQNVEDIGIRCTLEPSDGSGEVYAEVI